MHAYNVTAAMNIVMYILQLSLVEYDSEVNDLKVVSLHLFEDDDIRVSSGVSLATMVLTL